VRVSTICKQKDEQRGKQSQSRVVVRGECYWHDEGKEEGGKGGDDPGNGDEGALRGERQKVHGCFGLMSCGPRAERSQDSKP
jgi:hypothetical protein